MIIISELKKDNLNTFLHYLTIHLSENGQNGMPLFQPLSREQSKLDEEWKRRFENGLNKTVGEIGWRKLWVAINQENNIVGHIDIRSHNRLNAEHRVILGMGVDSNFRNLKVGQKLLEFAIDYCKNQPKISWIDLEVMTINIPAIRLYKKLKFQELNIIIDMFKIDNVSYDYTSMTLNVEN